MSEIVLPWPPGALNPNKRCHWSVKSKAPHGALRAGAGVGVSAAKADMRATQAGCRGCGCCSCGVGKGGMK